MYDNGFYYISLHLYRGAAKIKLIIHNLNPSNWNGLICFYDQIFLNLGHFICYSIFIFHLDQIFIFLSSVQAISYFSNPSIWSVSFFHSITLLISFQFIWKQLRPRRPMCLLSPLSLISFPVSGSHPHPSISWRTKTLREEFSQQHVWPEVH